MFLVRQIPVLRYDSKRKSNYQKLPLKGAVTKWLRVAVKIISILRHGFTVPPPLKRRLMLRIHLFSHLRWQLPLKGEAFRCSRYVSSLPLEGKIPPRCGGNVTKWQRGTAPSEGARRTAVDEVYKRTRQTVIYQTKRGISQPCDMPQHLHYNKSTAYCQYNVENLCAYSL